MNENNEHSDTAPDDTDQTQDTIYDVDGVVREAFVDGIAQSIEDNDSDAIRDALRDLHESEVGDVLAAIEEDDRDTLVELAGDDFDFAALTEVDEAIRLAICRKSSQPPGC